MKIDDEFRIVEIGRPPNGEAGQSEVLLVNLDGQQLKIVGLNDEQAREVAACFGDTLRVTLEIRKKPV